MHLNHFEDLSLKDYTTIESVHLRFIPHICKLLTVQFSIFYFQYEHFDKDFDIKRCLTSDVISRMTVFYYCMGLFTFIVPLIIIIHNYARVSYTLVKSLKQNAQLMEGNEQE